MVQEVELNQEIEELKRQVEIICNSLFCISKSLRFNVYKQNCTENIAIAQCVLQIAFCKMKSILFLFSGISIVPQKESIKILDIPSMVAIKRSLFELVFIVHNIFAMTDNDNEMQILLDLWKIRGFNNRQNIDGISDEQKMKQKDEKLYIEELRRHIVDVASKMDISDKAKKQLEKCVKSESSMPKGFVFNKENGTIVSFGEISFTASAKELFQDDKVFNAIYPLLSIHAHPSYLGILQFGQMFDGQQDKRYLRTILTGMCLLSSFLIDDLNEHINGVRFCFDKLPEENKKIINACITFKKVPKISSI